MLYLSIDVVVVVGLASMLLLRVEDCDVQVLVSPALSVLCSVRIDGVMSGESRSIYVCSVVKLSMLLSARPNVFHAPFLAA